MTGNDLLSLDGKPDAQLVVLEKWLDEAAQKRIVRPLPNAESRFTAQSFGPGQLRVIRNRLYRLGYLATDSEKDDIDDELRSAIKQFQREARLTVDGWVGMQSWQALQELFAFEPPTKLQQWLDGKKITPALHRAAHLRLYTFGLLDDRSQASLASIVDGFNKWNRIIHLMHDEPIYEDEDVTEIELIGRLFDFDQLQSFISKNMENILKHLERGMPADRDLLKRFLICNIKIELWLLGYENVKPDGKPQPITLRRVRVGEDGKIKYSYSPLYRVIREYWKDQEISDHHATVPRIILRTISGLVDLNLIESDTASERRTRAKEIIKDIEGSGQDLSKHWHQVSWGARIWDGARRLWRFLTGIFRRGIDWISKKISQLIRVAHQAAADAFSLVNRSFRAFIDSVDLLFSSEIAGSTDKIAMYHDRDFDYRVFVSSAASPTEINAFLNQHKVKIKRFHATIRILKVFLHIAIASVKIAFAPWGWWSLIRALIGLYGEFNEADAELIEEPLSA